MLGAAMALLALQAAPAASVDSLGWMSGRWEAVEGQQWTEESWSAPRAGVMLGYSRTAQNGTVRAFEFLRLQAGADGVPVYWGSPGGEPAVGFRLTASTPASATFDNPGHDYPQRLHYVRDGETMVATISAIDGSRPVRWTFRRQ